MLLTLFHGSTHFLEQVAGKNEVGETLVCGIHDFPTMALPVFVALVNEDDVLTDAHHAVHVMRVDDGRRVVFLGDAAEQLVDDK